MADDERIYRALEGIASKQEGFGETLTGVRLDLLGIKGDVARVTGEVEAHIADEALHPVERLNGHGTRLGALEKIEAKREGAEAVESKFEGRKWAIWLAVASTIIALVLGNVWQASG